MRSPQALKLGYVPLTDSLPLWAAREGGFFDSEGLQVELCPQVSWSNIRDKLVFGHLDAAQMLSPMVLASSLGLGGLRKPLLTAFATGLNGNGITVSRQLFHAIQAKAEDDSPIGLARALQAVISERKAQGLSPLVFAKVFPWSSHAYQLRYWMAAGGIDPDRDVELLVLPPSQMVQNLAEGKVDGFCVGEPWNAAALEQGVGYCLLSGYEVWQNAPEKVIGVTREWHDTYTDTHAALLRALSRACQWTEVNLEDALAFMAQNTDVNMPAATVARALRGELPCGLNQLPRSADQFQVFYRYQANFPWRSQGRWYLEQMQRWEQVPRGADLAALLASCYRPDFYRAVLAGVVPVPLSDDREEGLHASNWAVAANQSEVTVGPNRFLEGGAP